MRPTALQESVMASLQAMQAEGNRELERMRELIARSQPQPLTLYESIEARLPRALPPVMPNPPRLPRHDCRQPALEAQVKALRVERRDLKAENKALRLENAEFRRRLSVRQLPN